MKEGDSHWLWNFLKVSGTQEALESGFEPERPALRNSDPTLCSLHFCFQYWFRRAAGLQGFLTPDTLQILRLIKDFPNYLPQSASS